LEVLKSLKKNAVAENFKHKWMLKHGKQPSVMKQWHQVVA
jgi:hypothetical protein